MSRFFNPALNKLTPYTPGEQPKDMKYIKLNTNESPYPPSPSVIAAAEAEADKLQLYPDPECTVLKQKIAQLYGVDASNVFVSNGSDDILNFAFMAFSGNGKTAVFPEITYGFYPVFANLNGVPYKTIPLNKDFTINPEDYYNAEGPVFIANPNAPTGIALTVEQIENIVKNNPDNVVVIDEAYVDFGAESCYPLTGKYRNLLVIQTYSKSRSMAGARLGFAIGCSELTGDLNTIKFSTNPYSINRMTMAAGIAAIDDNNYYMDNCRKIAETREYVTEELTKLGFEVIPSKTNFVFAKSAATDGGELYTKLRQKGVLVRHFDSEKIRQYNRITIGSREQMECFIQAVKQIVTME
ncbi:MAG: histidinol-phosphate transaminase [Clostridia bacterium]|nr:histidinol-phosphate transaminase [Clostridia bacterium]